MEILALFDTGGFGLFDSLAGFLDVKNFGTFEAISLTLVLGNARRIVVVDLPGTALSLLAFEAFATIL